MRTFFSASQSAKIRILTLSVGNLNGCDSLYTNIKGKQTSFSIENDLSFCNGGYANFCEFDFIFIPNNSFKLETKG